MPTRDVPAASDTRYFKESDVKDPRAWYQIMDFVTGASAKFGYSSQCTAVDNGDTVFDAKFDKRNRRLVREKVYVVSETPDGAVGGTAVLVIFEKCVFVRNLCLLTRSPRFRESFFRDLRGVIRHYSNDPVVACASARKAGVLGALGLRKTRYAAVRGLDPAEYILGLSAGASVFLGRW